MATILSDIGGGGEGREKQKRKLETVYRVGGGFFFFGASLAV